MTVIRAGSVPRLPWVGGGETIPLIAWQSAAENNKITTGISSYRQGTAAHAQLRRARDAPGRLGHVTCTFAATGETAEHLSAADQLVSGT